VSTVEASFMTLFEAIGTRAVASIYARRKNAPRGKRLNATACKNIMPKLLDAGGDLCAGRWGASSETCKKLNYETILVNIDIDESGSQAT
jgi:hypothetical protein